MAGLVALVILVRAAEARSETVQLLIGGIHCAECASKVTASLSEVPSLKMDSPIAKPKRGDTVLISVQMDTRKANLGDIAKAAAGTATPHRDKGAPSVTLVVPAAGLSNKNADRVMNALKKVKGVNVKASEVDLKKKEIHVRLDEKGGARLADIDKALENYK
jgi:copper chaperone CopZ